MPKTPVAVIAQHPAHLPGLVIMIHYQRFFCSADDALFCRSLQFFQGFVRNNATKLTPTDATSVRCTARTAPAIQPVPLFVVRREELGGSGLFSLASGTS